jgi:hypothetical protein
MLVLLAAVLREASSACLCASRSGVGAKEGGSVEEEKGDADAVGSSKPGGRKGAGTSGASNGGCASAVEGVVDDSKPASWDSGTGVSDDMGELYIHQRFRQEGKPNQELLSLT